MRNALILMNSRKKIDCSEWSRRDVRDHVMTFGEYCRPLAEAFFADNIHGLALQTTDPESTLQDYANYLSKNQCH